MATGKQIRITALLVIDIIFFLLEAIVGYAVHSLALIADSFHMLNDIISLIVALWAVKVATTKGADAKYTYGWKRAEILGALINAVFLIALCFSILIEAIQRLISPAIITNPKLILVVGTLGLLSNFVGLFLFHDHGHSHGGGHSHSHDSVDSDEESSLGAILPGNVVNSYDERTSLLKKQQSNNYTQETGPNDYHTIPTGEHSHSHGDNHEHGHSHESKAPKQATKSMNMEGVFLHVLGDALGNVGVILTALFIWKTDYSWRYYADPVISLVITAIIFSSALPLCKRSSRILLQATPVTVSADDVQSEIVQVEGVKSVHDFHVWNLTEDIFIASLHVQIDAQADAFLVIAGEIRAILHTYGIHNATVQPEFTANVSSDIYKQFTKIAGGKVSRNSSSTNVPLTYGTEGDVECIVDSAVNCNTEQCIGK